MGKRCAGEKVDACRRECVDQHPVFECDDSVRYISLREETIAALQDFLFAADSHLESSVGDIGGLSVRMMMNRAHGSP